MPKFKVKIEYTTIAYVDVEADNHEEAMAIVDDGLDPEMEMYEQELYSGPYAINATLYK